jgi:nucleotide-binding universal stress UspA family protein
MDRLLKSAGHAIPHVVCGEPVEELVRLAASRRIDLIIAPSKGISGFKRLYTGTIVERLVRRINKPVLVIRPGIQPRPSAGTCLKQVMAGISPDGQRIIVSRSAQAARLFDAGLHLVQVMEAPPDNENEPYEIAQLHAQKDILQDLMAVAQTENLPVDRITADVLTGIPGEVIDAYAAKIGADLIVVGVRRTGVLKKTLIGSTTEALLRHSRCSILTLPVAPDRAA